MKSKAFMFEKKPLISVIILNYNGRKFLEASIPSLLNQTYTTYEIILVDNGSTDDSLKYIFSNYAQIKVVKSPYNSFSAGNNAGIKQAKGDYIFILNNDVELDKDCLKELMESVKHSEENVGMWATKILNYYQRNIIDNTGLLIYPDGSSRGRGRLEVDDGKYNNIEEVCFPSGCAGLYKKEMLDQIGLFDEDFRFFVEDSDLGFRGRLYGWKCFYVPKVKVYHMYSATCGSYSPQKAFLVERNRLWLAIKNFPLPVLLLNPYFTFRRYLYQVYSVFVRRGSASKFVERFSSFQLIWILIKSWISAFFGFSKMLRKRRMIQKNKNITNKEIYSWFKKFGISANELTLKE